MARLGAVEVSKMKPTLDKHGIDFVAVGLHTKMADDFLTKSDFKGELVINEKKDIFAGLKVAGYLSLLSPTTIKQIRKSKAMNLGGILDSTDGFQLGGLVVIDPPPEGEIIYQWDQPQMGVYPPVEEVLKHATSGMEAVEGADEKTRESKTPVEVPKENQVASGPPAVAVNSKSEDGKVVE